MTNAHFKPDLITHFFELVDPELMPDWLKEGLKDSNMSYVRTGLNEYTAQFGNTHAGTLLTSVTGFILLCIRQSDSTFCTDVNPGYERSCIATLVLSDKLKSKVRPQLYKVLNTRDFESRLLDTTSDIKRVLSISGITSFDEMLSKFASAVISYTYERDINELSDNDCLDIYERFLSSMEEHCRKPSLDSFNFDDLDYSDDEELDLGDDDEESLIELEEELQDAIDKGELSVSVGLTETLSANCSPEVEQLIEQLTFMTIARGIELNNFGTVPSNHDIENKNPSFPRVTADTFLASLFGSPLVLEKIAEMHEIKPVQIRFHPSALKRRKALKSVSSIKKTMYINGFSDTFFHHASQLKSKIAFDASFESFASDIFTMNLKGDLVDVNYPHIAKLLKLGEKPSVRVAFEKANLFQNELRETVIGQSDAIEKITELYSQNFYPYNASISNSNNTITLLGSSPSGKSLLAGQFIKALTRSENDLGFEVVSLSMEDYPDKYGAMKLLGSGSQYVDSTLGYLTLPAELNPRICFVFENFDKAHQSAQDVLLSLIEKGELVDSTSNRTVSFKQCFFIFTTSAGSDLIEKLYA